MLHRKQGCPAQAPARQSQAARTLARVSRSDAQSAGEHPAGWPQTRLTICTMSCSRHAPVSAGALGRECDDKQVLNPPHPPADGPCRPAGGPGSGAQDAHVEDMAWVHGACSCQAPHCAISSARWQKAAQPAAGVCRADWRIWTGCWQQQRSAGSSWACSAPSLLGPCTRLLRSVLGGGAPDQAMLELLDEGLVDAVAEVLHGGPVHAQHDRVVVVWQLALQGPMLLGQLAPSQVSSQGCCQHHPDVRGRRLIRTSLQARSALAALRWQRALMMRRVIVVHTWGCPASSTSLVAVMH